eukprot:COSAG01_NODE_1751_length_9323_cov_5.197507_9_plen_78_part_00
MSILDLFYVYFRSIKTLPLVYSRCLRFTPPMAACDIAAIAIIPAMAYIVESYRNGDGSAVPVGVIDINLAIVRSLIS